MTGQSGCFWAMHRFFRKTSLNARLICDRLAPFDQTFVFMANRGVVIINHVEMAGLFPSGRLQSGGSGAGDAPFGPKS